MNKSFMVDTKQKSEFKREILPAGSYVGTLYSIVDLGTQISEYQGKPTKNKKIRLGWELPTEMRVFNEEKGMQPMAIYKEYTLSFSEKANLRKDLKSWRGKDLSAEELTEDELFDLASMIGQNCLLSIGVKQGKENQYNVINGIGAPVKGSTDQPLINKPLIWLLDDGINDVFQSFPQFIREKIEKCVEWSGTAEQEEKPQDDSDLPF